MKHVAIAIVTIVILALAWFLASPLFIDRTVDEPFDLSLPNGRLNYDAIMSMPDEKREEMQQEIMDAAANAPDRASAEAMPGGSPMLLARGMFIDADAIHKGTGTALLYALPDGRHVVRFEDFRATNGPALVVYLAEHENPTSAADVTDHRFVNIGKLKGNVGNQNYEIPANIDISPYRSVVIWCELFGVLFSPAALLPLG